MKLHVHMERTEAGDRIVLDQPVVFELLGDTYTIPAGFVSDGMSIPRCFWGWLSPQLDFTTLLPSVIHDWLYSEHVCTREEADQWYRDALIDNGFSRGKACLIYAGLRCFGRSHWQEKKEN